MIERICPKCKVPMNGEKCVKPDCGCTTEISSTIYWCNSCNIPVFEKNCSICGNETVYISTDIRPVFPEENLLISLLLKNDPFKFRKSSMWYGSNTYIVDGEKIKLSVSKINKLPLEEIKALKDKYDLSAPKIDYKYFNEHVKKFIKANEDRYNYITEEAVNYIQQYKEKYAIEDMMVSFSGGKDSTVTSHLVNRALGTNKVLHIFGDTSLEFPYILEYKKRM